MSVTSTLCSMVLTIVGAGWGHHGRSGQVRWTGCLARPERRNSHWHLRGVNSAIASANAQNKMYRYPNRKLFTDTIRIIPDINQVISPKRDRINQKNQTYQWNNTINANPVKLWNWVNMYSTNSNPVMNTHGQSDIKIVYNLKHIKLVPGKNIWTDM